ncbi:uncharacterized protein LOC132919804 [Rhopalosiphum padi]|uniref:uncharacterized protein LOC132919804 n=1 Tax=Rhopalosiphum padi TaxID=40932 RepID=UPI00298EBA8C|nr:uncharacterized protein LOC132919804 [Rhopalosiphum padi]
MVINNNKLLTYWPIALFWRTFGVFPANMLDNNPNSNTLLPILFTVLLSASCVYVLIVGPAVVCRIGDKCSSESVRILKEMYPNIANMTSVLSRISLSYSVTMGFEKYRETMECYETYSPTTATDAAQYRVFTATAVCACLLLVVPVNVLRLWMLWTPDGDNPALMQGVVFYVFIYIQNVTMCCSETQFVQQCFMLYCKLKTVNDDVAELGGSAGLARFSRHSLHENAAATPDAPGIAVAAKDASDSVMATADAVETLRIRHWLLRESIGCLNRLFGVQLGMSVCALCVMSFFDIYYETFHVMGKYAMSGLIVYCWMLHYAVRYMGIILMCHYTTKQAIYTKTLIANLKSNCLDCSINQELHLFLDQLSHSSVEFTACDVFTLNIRLIISTFAAGLTYLVILIQYQTNMKSSTYTD